MTKFCLIVSGMLILSINSLTAQEKIITDRPDATEAAIITPLHYFQMEFGFGKEDYGDKNYDIIHPTYLLKYGLAKNFELRLENTLITNHQRLTPKSVNATGFTPLEIGFRTALFNQKKFIPTTALIVHTAIPAFASCEFKAEHIAPAIVLSMEHEITKTYEIGYNLGAEWDGFSTQPYWTYTFSNEFELSEKWETYIELYGSIKRNEHPENNIDGGFGYYVNNNIKLDAYAGFGISKSASDYIVGAGISFRFK